MTTVDSNLNGATETPVFVITPAADGATVLEHAVALARCGLKPTWIHAPLFGSSRTPTAEHPTADDCTCRKSSCAKSRGKHPSESGWQKIATCDEEVLREQFAGLSVEQPNIGVVLGQQRDGYLVAVDIDDAARFAELEEQLGRLPETPQCDSGRGTRSFFTLPTDTPVDSLKNITGLAGKSGVDVKVAGGQVVVAPSMHQCGKRYAWSRTGPVAELPKAWVLALLAPIKKPSSNGAQKNKSNGAQKDNGVFGAVFRMPEGERNQRLFLIGAKLRSEGRTEEEIFIALSAHNNAFCKPPLDEAEVRTIARSAAKYKPKPSRKNPGCDAAGRPRVVRGMDIHRVVADLDAALGKTDPRIFQRGSDLVIVRGVTADDAKRLHVKFAPDSIIIAPLKPSTLLARITEFIDYGYYGFIEDEEGNKTKVWKGDLPSGAVLAAFLSAPFWAHIRTLRGIAVTPLMHLDGSIVAGGYDAETQYLVATNIELPTISDSPTKADAEAALQELQEPFAEFPYETSAERYTPVAIALTLLLRAVIEGNVPAFVNGAPQKNCGKSLAMKGGIMLATGRIAASNTWPKLEEEQEKMIGAAAEAGADVLLFDNVAEGAVIGGAPLDKVLTCDGVNGFRLLGRTELKRLPWNATVCITANRPNIGGDSDRRVVQATMIRRNEPIKYTHEELLPYILTERARLLAAAYTLVRAWVQAGAPRENIRRLDSFERWGWTVAAMIRWAGGGDVRELVLDSAGTEQDELEEDLLRALHEYLQRNGKPDVTVHDLIADAYKPNGESVFAPPSADLAPLREAIEAFGGFVGKEGRQKLDVRKFGNRLARMKDVLHGRYRLRLDGITSGRSRWRVELRGVQGDQGGQSKPHAGAHTREASRAGKDPPSSPDPPNGEKRGAEDYVDELAGMDAVALDEAERNGVNAHKYAAEQGWSAERLRAARAWRLPGSSR